MIEKGYISDTGTLYETKKLDPQDGQKFSEPLGQENLHPLHPELEQRWCIRVMASE